MSTDVPLSIVFAFGKRSESSYGVDLGLTGCLSEYQSWCYPARSA